MDNGRIIERGTYADLVAAGGQFSQLVAEYGVAEDTDMKQAGQETTAVAEDKPKDANVPATKLMQGDERATGAVGSDAYAHYLRAAGGLSWLPFLMLLLVMAQVTNVCSSRFDKLGFIGF
jgi:ATP-binding cassette subfamily C (CFTR/MRP) protein 1